MEAAPADEPAEGILPEAASGESPPRGAEQGLARVEFLVGRMQRTTPIGAIGEFLEAQQGVRRAQVDAAVERVTVDYNARLTCPEELAYIMEETGYVAVPLPSEDEGEADGPAMYRQQDVSLHPFFGFFLSPLFGAAALAANSLQLVLSGMYPRRSQFPEHRVAEDPIRVSPSPFAQNALSKEEGEGRHTPGAADASRASRDHIM